MAHRSYCKESVDRGTAPGVGQLSYVNHSVVLETAPGAIMWRRVFNRRGESAMTLIVKVRSAKVMIMMVTILRLMVMR